MNEFNEKEHGESVRRMIDYFKGIPPEHAAKGIVAIANEIIEHLELQGKYRLECVEMMRNEIKK